MEQRRRFNIRYQIQSSAKVALVLAIGVLAISIAAFQSSVPLKTLMLDPSYLSKQPWYTGLFSYIAIVLWTISATAAAFGGWVARKTNRATAAMFLISGAAVTSLLLFDDIFALHSAALPKIGVPKTIAQLAIVAPTPYWLYRYKDDILRTRWYLLTMSLGFFAFSVLIDGILSFSNDNTLLLEDGAKFLGVILWCQYFVLTARDIANSTINSALNQDAKPAQDNTSAQDASIDNEVFEANKGKDSDEKKLLPY